MPDNMNADYGSKHEAIFQEMIYEPNHVSLSRKMGTVHRGMQCKDIHPVRVVLQPPILSSAWGRGEGWAVAKQARSPRHASILFRNPGRRYPSPAPRSPDLTSGGTKPLGASQD